MLFSGFMLRRGFSFDDFVAQSGFDIALVDQWQRRKRPPSERELRDLAFAFGVSVTELLAPRPGEPVAPGPRNDLPLQPKLYHWDSAAQTVWGERPHARWGYLRLQLTAGAQPRWYPLSGEQAWLLQTALDTKPQSEPIFTATMNNRMLTFAQDRVFDASLLSNERSIGRPDFALGWDDDGLTPELYPLLRAWARQDLIWVLKCSRAVKDSVDEILNRKGMRRRDKIIMLVDGTYVERISDAPVAVVAEARDVQSIRKWVPLGMQTIFLGDTHANREFVIPVDDIRLLDMPATDLGIVSTVAVGSETPRR